MIGRDREARPGAEAGTVKLGKARWPWLALPARATIASLALSCFFTILRALRSFSFSCARRRIMLSGAVNVILPK